MKSLLQVRALSRTFGSGKRALQAVKGVSFDLAPGEIVAVVGESGSGKSTLARLILRLLSPTEGQMLLEGQDVQRIPLRTYWRSVQAVFQDPYAAFNQFYSVQRLLQKALTLFGPLPTQERKARMHLALQSVGLEPERILGKYPHQLSGGQRQRVMVARAIMLRPRLLVADEPTSALDASLRATVLNLLKDVRQKHGMSIIFITHDIGQAYYLSDRILVMYRGEVVEEGPVEQVVEQSQHPYTKRLLSDVPRFHG
ncbi:MAG: ABC transporter ATP-binding protein [Meiothermus sp.]|uniref:ABC transporter ATP-binding protein n=1 Tax=Meiothermus sp. TaxID=1955249 RepID=UPI0025EF3580|nr:ABC transporter ATP-binding protein [Meiothermus sp.]MCS7058757.1 ABC transporter ATP-binding protein [Meiothermus sp.]MCS7195376.1 ABC transporter ATP-binding protein [Meiothermus sp.]MDW8091023.1 ABC transporter ATP-binding protein [Meiothermus sp.]MDW8482232.1 ABC transporter ATP-binding protein [Meiothermus sp.]